MGVYKIIFRADRSKTSENQITWEQGCPLIFDAIQISRNTETGTAFLQAKLINIDADAAASFKSKIDCRFADDSMQSIEVEPLDADIPSGEYYEFRPVELSRGDAVFAEAFIESVVTQSGKWESSGKVSLPPERVLLDLSKEAERERELQLERFGCKTPHSAAQAAVIEHGGWTMCACGQPNVGTRTCVACGLNLSEYDSTLENEDALIRSAQDRTARAKEEEAERQRKQAETKARIKKVAPFVAIPLAIAVFASLIIFAVIPAVRHHQAENLINQGEYQAAIDAFYEMNDIEGAKKAEEAKREHDYQAACDLLESGAAETALEQFEALGSYKDSEQKARDSQNAIDYAHAESLFKNGEYEGALKEFSTLGDYADSVDRAKESQYRWAERSLQSGDMTSSAILFGKLGDYSDAREKSLEAWSEVAAKETVSAGKSRVCLVKNDGMATAVNEYSVSADFDETIGAWSGLSAVASGGVVVGLKNDGTVCYAHPSEYDSFGKTPAWSNIVSVAAADDLVLALEANGTVEADCYLFEDDDLKGWNDVIAISTCGEHTALGLRVDGTVLVEGNLDLDFDEMNEIESWTDIVAIDGGTVGTVVGVKSDGTVVSTGLDGVYKELENWTDIVSVSVGDNVVVGLRSDGTAVASHHKTYGVDGDISVSDWADLVSISAGSGYVVGLKADGSVYYSSEDKDSKLQQVQEWGGVLVP